MADHFGWWVVLYRRNWKRSCEMTLATFNREIMNNSSSSWSPSKHTTHRIKPLSWSTAQNRKFINFHRKPFRIYDHFGELDQRIQCNNAIAGTPFSRSRPSCPPPLPLTSLKEQYCKYHFMANWITKLLNHSSFFDSDFVFIRYGTRLWMSAFGIRCVKINKNNK